MTFLAFASVIKGKTFLDWDLGNHKRNSDLPPIGRIPLKKGKR